MTKFRFLGELSLLFKSLFISLVKLIARYLTEVITRCWHAS